MARMMEQAQDQKKAQTPRLQAAAAQGDLSPAGGQKKGSSGNSGKSSGNSSGSRREERRRCAAAAAGPTSQAEHRP